MAHSHILGFWRWGGYGSLSLATTSGDCSTKEETVPGNWLSIINITYVTTVGVAYNSKWAVLIFLIAVACRVSSPYNAQGACSFEVLESLLGETDVTYSKIRVVATELSYHEGYVWSRSTSQIHQFSNQTLVGYHIHLGRNLQLDRGWGMNLLSSEELLDDTSSFLQILRGLVCTLSDRSSGFPLECLGWSPIRWWLWPCPSLSYWILGWVGPSTNLGHLDSGKQG